MGSWKRGTVEDNRAGKGPLGTKQKGIAAIYGYTLGHLSSLATRSSVTEGEGIGFNCNEEKEQYQRLGIGRLDRHDHAKRKILLEDVVGYIVMSDQFLRAVQLGSNRRFETSISPEKSKAGRPRIDDDMEVE